MVVRKPSLKGFLLALALGFLVAGPAAHAQNWYYIDNEPVSLPLAQQMAWQGLPVGYYWLINGTWWWAPTPAPVSQTPAPAPAWNPATSDILRKGMDAMATSTIDLMHAMSGRR